MSIIFDKSTEKTAMQMICPVSISETDCCHKVKPVVIFNYMQDLAAKSIIYYNSNFSCEELLQKGLGWFLIRYRIEFDTCPKDVKELLVKTECRGAWKMTTFRDFEVYDNTTGNRILRAGSSWLIVDLNNKSVVNISQEYPEFLKFEKREDDLVLQKLRAIDRVDGEKVFTVRYDDIDVNNHVNNTVYIAWALETLGYDFRTQHDLKSLDIYFKHDVKYGEDIVSQVNIDKDNLISHHVIKNASTGEELCLLKAEFVKL